MSSSSQQLQSQSQDQSQAQQQRLRQSLRQALRARGVSPQSQSQGQQQAQPQSQAQQQQRRRSIRQAVTAARLRDVMRNAGLNQQSDSQGSQSQSQVQQQGSQFQSQQQGRRHRRSRRRSQGQQQNRAIIIPYDAIWRRIGLHGLRSLPQARATDPLLNDKSPFMMLSEKPIDDGRSISEILGLPEGTIPYFDLDMFKKCLDVYPSGDLDVQLCINYYNSWFGNQIENDINYNRQDDIYRMTVPVLLRHMELVRSTTSPYLVIAKEVRDSGITITETLSNVLEKLPQSRLTYYLEILPELKKLILTYFDTWGEEIEGKDILVEGRQQPFRVKSIGDMTSRELAKIFVSLDILLFNLSPADKSSHFLEYYKQNQHWVPGYSFSMNYIIEEAKRRGLVDDGSWVNFQSPILDLAREFQELHPDRSDELVSSINADLDESEIYTDIIDLIINGGLAEEGDTRLDLIQQFRISEIMPSYELFKDLTHGEFFKCIEIARERSGGLATDALRQYFASVSNIYSNRVTDRTEAQTYRQNLPQAAMTILSRVRGLRDIDDKYDMINVYVGADQRYLQGLLQDLEERRQQQQRQQRQQQPRQLNRINIQEIERNVSQLQRTRQDIRQRIIQQRGQLKKHQPVQSQSQQPPVKTQGQQAQQQAIKTFHSKGEDWKPEKCTKGCDGIRDLRCKTGSEDGQLLIDGMTNACMRQHFIHNDFIYGGDMLVITKNGTDRMSPSELYSYLLNFIDTTAISQKIIFKIEENEVIDVAGVSKQLFTTLGDHVKDILKQTPTGRYLLDKKTATTQLRIIDARIIGKLAALSINPIGYKINVPFSYGILGMMTVGRFDDSYRNNEMMYEEGKNDCFDLTLSELLYFYFIDNGADQVKNVIDTFINFNGKPEDMSDAEYFVDYILADNNYAFEFFGGKYYKYSETDKFEWLRQHLFYELIHQYRDAILLFITGFNSIYTYGIDTVKDLDLNISSPSVNRENMESIVFIPHEFREINNETMEKILGYIRRYISEGKYYQQRQQGRSSDNDKEEFWTKLLLFITAQVNPSAEIKIDITVEGGQHVKGDRDGKIIRYPSAHTCFNMLELPDYSTYELFAKAMTFAIKHSSGFNDV